MSQKAFLGQLADLEDKIDKVQPVVLRKVVDHLVSASPDDTGAYILSHSIGQSGNVGYSISSKGRPSARDQHRWQAYSQLMAQVNAIPPGASWVFVGNNSPHANYVEFGGPKWNRGGYYVYSELRNILPLLIDDAVMELGLK